jgi:hypothetical protein
VTHGVDVIKIMATGGNMTAPPSDPTSPNTTARSSPRPLTRHTPTGSGSPAHAHGPQGIADAFAAGVDLLRADPEKLRRVVYGCAQSVRAG